MTALKPAQKIVADLEALGLIEKIEPHMHAVGHCYRCKSIVEPNLSMQWFVDVKPLAEKAIEAVKDGRTRIIPSTWEKTYFEWMNNIRDWCISRQIWWGHRIPAWFCSQCDHITVAKHDPEACAACGSPDITQESDVLDTWFSSALWPFSTLGWPDKTPELANLYPTSCLVTGFDILFFWVARMMMMGLKFMGDVPFRDVYIHALVRDAHGHKMSKSKGNVIDPLEIIEKFGTDSFRFTLTAMAAQGRDISLSEERIEGYRHFVNKLWNASRFALMHVDGCEPGLPAGNLELKDRWILSRLNSVIIQVRDALEDYRFNEAANALYQFVWREFCDWYVEMAKPSLYDRDNAAQRSATQQVLFHVLRTIVELLHPIMPFVTEEIWQKLPGKGESIVVTAFPQAVPARILPDVETSMEHLFQFVTAVRTIRAEMNIAPSARPAADLLCHDSTVEALLQQHTDLICSLAGLSQATVHTTFARSNTAAAGVVDAGEVFVELEGIIDFNEEGNRLEREAAKLKKDIDFISGKLGNPKFVDNAPADIVQKEREKLSVIEGKQAKLQENIARIASLRTS